MGDGTTTKLVIGIGGLIVLVIIVFVLVSTILEADLFSRGSTTISDEEYGSANSTGYTLTNFSSIRFNYVIIAVANFSSQIPIPLANVSLDQATGIVTNTTATDYLNTTMNYSYTTRGRYEIAPTSMSGNFTTGMDNVSEKIPTILLIAAVVLLFGILVLLVARSRQMGIGGGGSL